MHSICHVSRASPLGRSAVRILAAGLALLLAPRSLGDGEQSIVRVEQDWRLVLIEPQDTVTAPQFHTVISPTGDADGIYFQITWNYRELPEFGAGGLQLQAWNGDQTLATRSVGEAALSGEAETITWTQVLETNGLSLTARITNGHSSSWGDFGGESMRLTVSGEVPNLNGYRTSVTQQNSWISYGSNRVTLLVITQVRRYSHQGLVSVDSTPRVIFYLQDPQNPE